MEDGISDEVDGYTPPFCIHERRLYTLSDLRHEQNVLRDFCEVETVDEMPVSDWLGDDDLKNNLVFLFNQLFGSHCYRCGLAYNPNFRRTYFPRETDNDEDKKFERRWTSQRTKRSDNRTVAQHYQYGAFAFWRHLAAEFSFVEFGGQWFLQVTPKYFFTDDGRTPCDPQLVGPYTTRLKALEHNPQVLNHVLFWADTLARGAHRIDMTLFGEPLIVIEKEPVTTIAPFAIRYDPAVYEDTSPSPQLTLFEFDELEEDSDDY